MFQLLLICACFEGLFHICKYDYLYLHFTRYLSIRIPIFSLGHSPCILPSSCLVPTSPCHSFTVPIVARSDSEDAKLGRWLVAYCLYNLCPPGSQGLGFRRACSNSNAKMVPDTASSTVSPPSAKCYLRSFLQHCISFAQFSNFRTYSQLISCDFMLPNTDDLPLHTP